VPDVPGLGAVPYLTSETLFELREQPQRLAILGAGPIGCEMAQAFSRLGTAVTLVEAARRVLPGEDADAAVIVARQLAADGVTLRLGVTLAEVSKERDGLRLRAGDGLQAVPFGQRADVDCTHLLIAAGRTPNIDDLNLPAAGVAVNADGVVVDDRLRTTNRRVFAAGDVCSTFKFTHAADALARIAIQNALFFGRKRASALVIPWCTYTDPEVAHVGQYEHEARSAGRHVETITIPLTDVDRAVIDDERDGFVRVHHERGRLLGCTVVASRAGEMIAVAAHVLTHGASLSALGSTIHPYPTLNNAFRAAGDAYSRTRLTPGVRRALRRYFQFGR
jgi:pyruvate/2-oxoglutarate dehydrogenase complex dihydrolipoamide dehydrogenase (E3) component